MKRAPRYLIAVAAIVFVTSSFDTFLSISLGPTVRITQLFAILLIVTALYKHRTGLTMELPLGSVCLLAWLLILLAFVPVADFWQKSFAYCVWLTLNIALSFAMVNLFSRDLNGLHILLKMYLASFILMALFGAIQFTLPLVGGPAIFVEQWWLEGSVPRVNGFSYEPSYYATYMIMGLTCLGSLRRSKIAEYRGAAWTLGYLLMFIAMILCSSRIGIGFAVFEVCLAPLLWLSRIIRKPKIVLGFRVSFLKMSLTIATACLLILAVGSATRFLIDDRDTARVLLNGTGFMGTGAHSVTEREDHLDSTLEVISNHPWMGRSLGGVTEAIASLSGTRPMNFDEAKYFEGQSVFGEVAAASGIPGMVPFFCFIVMTIVAPMRLATRTRPYLAVWLRALVVALIFEWSILQFNQNILRVYLWVHIAVLGTVYSAARRRRCTPGFEMPDTARPAEMSPSTSHV